MKKAQVGFGAYALFGMMMGLMVWIAFTQLLGPATDSAQEARSVDGLDCDNESISTGTKGTCIVVDWAVFGWAGAIVAVIIGLVAGTWFYRKKDETQ